MLHCWNFIFKYFSVFSVIYICVWGLENKKGWVPKNWCLQTVVLEKTLESPLDSKEVKPVNPKGNQPWIFIGRTGAEAETPVLWPPDAKNGPIGKDPDARKGWRQEEKGTTEDEMVGWHHRLNGYEFEQTLADSERQGSKLGVLPSMGSKSWTQLSDWTELNWTIYLTLKKGKIQIHILVYIYNYAHI